MTVVRRITVKGVFRLTRSGSSSCCISCPMSYGGLQCCLQQNPERAGVIAHASTAPPLLNWSLQGRQVHLTSTTDAVENVTLLHCPPDRRVRVEVPLRVFGEEVCPGLKSGGSLNWIKRTISCIADGHAVPASFELDVR